MFAGDYSYELAKERMQTAIRAHDQDVLAKRLRSAGKGPRGGWVARMVAPIVSLIG